MKLGLYHSVILSLSKDQFGCVFTEADLILRQAQDNGLLFS